MTTAGPEPAVPITSRIDHVAFAVEELDAADRRWRDELGGRWVAWSDPAQGFRSRQLRYRGGGKLELIAPVTPDDDSFMDRFLKRFGNRIHHVTLKVPDLWEAIDRLRAGGVDVIDIDDREPAWREGFCRPGQIGGLVVQVAESSQTDEDWARQVGLTPEPPGEDAAVFDGALLSHPDLDRAATVWRLLGATVESSADDQLLCRWPGEPLSIVVERGTTAGPVALRFSGLPMSVAASDEAALHE